MTKGKHERKDRDEVRRGAAPFTVDSAYGSVRPLDPPRPVEEVFDHAGEEHARHVVDEGK